jgi:hypothetical protein
MSIEVRTFLEKQGYKIMSLKELIGLNEVHELLLFSSFLATSALLRRLSSFVSCQHLILSLDGQRNVGILHLSFGAQRVSVVSFFVRSPDEPFLESLKSVFRQVESVAVGGASWRATLDDFLSKSPMGLPKSGPVLESGDFLVLYRPGWETHGSSTSDQVRSWVSKAEIGLGLRRLVVRGPRDNTSGPTEAELVDKAQKISNPELAVIGWSELCVEAGLAWSETNPEFLSSLGLLGSPSAIFAYEGTFALSLAILEPETTTTFVWPEEVDCFANLEDPWAKIVLEQSEWLRDVYERLRKGDTVANGKFARPVYLSAAHAEVLSLCNQKSLVLYVPRALAAKVWSLEVKLGLLKSRLMG